MKLILAGNKEKAVFESLADGPGIRLVLFTCGCPHRCKGCHNAKTWDIKQGVEVSVAELAEFLIQKFKTNAYSGLTLSGGDPLFQSEPLGELLHLLKKRIPHINIWCYTGYLYEEVPDRNILSYIDVLVDGKFEADKVHPKKKFRGSHNQRVLYLKNGQIEQEK